MPETDSVVNDPVLAEVLPIAGGLAIYELNPVPDTAPLAASVVNDPVFADVFPMLIPFIEPPDKFTPLLACVAIVPNPPTSVVEIVVPAVTRPYISVVTFV